MDRFEHETIFDDKMCDSLFEILKGNISGLNNFFDELKLKIDNANTKDLEIKDELKKSRLELWGDALSGIKYLNKISLELGYLFDKEHKGKSINLYKYYTIKKIHGRTIQIAEEIEVLLENGYPNGALSRWRSLYELQILLEYFALKQDDELYKMYYDHSIYSAYKFERSRRKEGYKNYTTKAFNELRDSVEKIKVEYDMSKFKEDLGWAYKYIPQNVPNRKRLYFSDIERQVDPENKLKLYYKRACAMTHLDSFGTFENMSVLDNFAATPVGPSNCGLSEPGQLTAISICRIMAAYNQLMHTTLGDIILMIVSGQEKFILEAFSSAQKAIEDNSSLFTNEDVE